LPIAHELWRFNAIFTVQFVGFF